MIEVNIIGTPIRYKIKDNEFKIIDFRNEDKTYSPGKIVKTCLGRLRCEEVLFNEEGEAYKMNCSVVRYEDEIPLRRDKKRQRY